MSRYNFDSFQVGGSLADLRCPIWQIFEVYHPVTWPEADTINMLQYQLGWESGIGAPAISEVSESPRRRSQHAIYRQVGLTYQQTRLGLTIS